MPGLRALVGEEGHYANFLLLVSLGFNCLVGYLKKKRAELLDYRFGFRTLFRVLYD